MKTKFEAPSVKNCTYTVEHVLSVGAQPSYVIETEKSFFVGETLDEAMRLWADNGQDESPVINVTRVGQC